MLLVTVILLGFLLPMATILIVKMTRLRTA